MHRLQHIWLTQLFQLCKLLDCVFLSAPRSARRRHIMPTDVGICQHLNMLAYMSASKYVGIFVNIVKICWHTCRHISHHSRMCRHRDMLAYMPASWCVGIYVGICTCQHIGQHKNKCVDIYVGMFVITSMMCRHLNVLAYMSASWCDGIYVASGHVNIFSSTRPNV